MSTTKRKQPVNKISNYCTKRSCNNSETSSLSLFTSPVEILIPLPNPANETKTSSTLTSKIQKPNDFFYCGNKEKGSYYGYETDLFDHHPPIPCRNVVINSRTAQIIEIKDGQW